jgi:hypothetical protein
VPMLVGEFALGSLNLYTADPEGLRSETDEVAASLLAEQGAVAFGSSACSTSWASSPPSWSGRRPGPPRSLGGPELRR